MLRTARLILTPIGGSDFADLRAIKADPSVFAVMRGGVRDAAQTAEDLANDVVAWGRHGFGIWAVREAGRFMGITGLAAPARTVAAVGVTLRVVASRLQGRGLAREAAFAALRFGHTRAGLVRIVGVARESNFGSRIVLGAIGMREAETFDQFGYTMILCESFSG